MEWSPLSKKPEAGNANRSLPVLDLKVLLYHGTVTLIQEILGISVRLDRQPILLVNDTLSCYVGIGCRPLSRERQGCRNAGSGKRP